jgi:RNA polymerase sigma-70 factor (ECF subfamily)
VTQSNPYDEEFVRLMQENQKAVFSLAYGKMGNVHDAEDVAQQVFFEIFQNARKLKDPQKAAGWLFKLTVNRCKDSFRKKYRRERREAEYAGLANQVEAVIAEDCGILDMVSQLREKFRTIVMLRYFAELSYAEISAMTGLSKNSIDGRLRAAKKELRRKLVEMNEETNSQ